MTGIMIPVHHVELIIPGHESLFYAANELIPLNTRCGQNTFGENIHEH